MNIYALLFQTLLCCYLATHEFEGVQGSLLNKNNNGNINKNPSIERPILLSRTDFPVVFLEDGTSQRLTKGRKGKKKERTKAEETTRTKAEETTRTKAEETTRTRTKAEETKQKKQANKIRRRNRPNKIRRNRRNKIRRRNRPNKIRRRNRPNKIKNRRNRNGKKIPWKEINTYKHQWTIFILRPRKS